MSQDPIGMAPCLNGICHQKIIQLLHTYGTFPLCHCNNLCQYKEVATMI